MQKRLLFIYVCLPLQLYVEIERAWVIKRLARIGEGGLIAKVADIDARNCSMFV